jgi:hypothetical protein
MSCEANLSIPGHLRASGSITPLITSFSKRCELVIRVWGTPIEAEETNLYIYRLQCWLLSLNHSLKALVNRYPLCPCNVYYEYSSPWPLACGRTQSPSRWYVRCSSHRSPHLCSVSIVLYQYWLCWLIPCLLFLPNSLFGITNLQVFVYSQSYKDDSIWSKLAVSWPSWYNCITSWNSMQSRSAGYGQSPLIHGTIEA